MAAKNSTSTPAKAPVAAKDSTIAASGNPAHPPAEKPAEEKPVARRDPFDTLLSKARAGSAQPENLPPGKAGLIVESLRIDGVVHSPNGMIAIVSNSQQRVYFLRDGDKLYDGSVEKIALDAISFHEIGEGRVPLKTVGARGDQATLPKFRRTAMKTNWPALGFSCLLLAGAAVAVPPASAQLTQQTPTGAAAPLASISAVDVAQPGLQTTVRIAGTGELHYQTSRLDSPPRLVLDFADTRLNVENKKVSSNFAPVLGVRMGQPNPGQSRIVIDLAKQVPFSTLTEGSNVTVFFTPAAVLATPTALRPAKRPAPRRLAAVNVPSMPLPSWLTGKDMGFARPGFEPAAPAPLDPPATTSQTPASAPVTEKKYTGDPISVNLKDVDLKDFFRLIHEISGLNVVLDPSVHGTVTLVLDEVPWDQGLDIVLRNNGLTKRNRRKRSANRHSRRLQARSRPAP